MNSEMAMEPYFVGSVRRIRPQVAGAQKASERRTDQGLASNLRLLTAREMQALVAQLTGFYHPGFEAYERLIGIVDTQSGQRVPQGLSASGALALRNLASSLGQKIVAREFFLDPAERVVFPDVDFALPLDEAFWRLQVRRISGDWFEFDLSAGACDQIVNRALDVQQRTDGRTALADFLATLLQHVGLYLS